MIILDKIFSKLGYKKNSVLANSKDQVVDKEFTKIFQYFPTWISKFVIDNNEYGGKADYSMLRTSILNLKELRDSVDFKNKAILELGPLEGGNSHILEKLGISKNVAIEGRVDSYIKCCVIKNIYNLKNTKFVLDDVRRISLEKYGKFDIAVVLGLLYHLDKPNELLQSLGTMVNTLILSTHYSDSDSPYPDALQLEIESKNGIYKGRKYIEDPDFDPNAGLENYSFWPYETDLLKMCEDAGFNRLEILAKNPNPNEKYKLIYLICSK